MIWRRRIVMGALLCGAALIVLALSLGDTIQGWSMSRLKHGLVLRREYGTEGFEYLFHEPSGKWVGRECQVRVEDKRRLPDPLVLTGPNSAISMLLFGGLTTESAPIIGGIENVQRFETYRWWWLDIPMGDDVVNSKSPQRVGVQVTWPAASDGSQEVEPMEVFVLPPIDTEPPQVWTAWQGPQTLRGGADAWYREVHRKRAPEAAPPARTPTFEVRCRAGLWETIYRRTK